MIKVPVLVERVERGPNMFIDVEIFCFSLTYYQVAGYEKYNVSVFYVFEFMMFG